MANVWTRFVEEWSQHATAEEAKDGLQRLGKPRPKSKAGAVDAVVHLFKGARGAEEVLEIAAKLLAEIRAEGIKGWAKNVTNRTLSKDNGIDAILEAFFPDDGSSRLEEGSQGEARADHDDGRNQNVSTDRRPTGIATGLDWLAGTLASAASKASSPGIDGGFDFDRMAPAERQLLLVGAKSVTSFLARLSNAMPQISLSEAQRRFRFDHNHPREGSVYALNPCRQDQYLVPASASERMAEEKLAAFIEISAALGARTIEIVSADVSQRARGGRVGLTKAAIPAALEAHVTSSCAVSRHVYQQFDCPMRPPHIPPEHQGWTDVDPLLRALVKTRLTARPRTAHFELRFLDTFEAVAKVQTALWGSGLDFGGKVKSLEASIWRFDIEFWPVDAREATHSCGEPLDPGASFCTRCGVRIR